jgi:hypothetical protein
MATQVSSGAKTHWLWAAVGFAGVFGLTSKFDDWLKCDERTFRQDLLAHERMTHLLNAAHLASCAHAAEKTVPDAGIASQEIQNISVSSDGGADPTNFTPAAIVCEEASPDGGGRILPTAIRLRDRAHQELIGCFSMRATPYGAFTASPAAASQ